MSRRILWVILVHFWCQKYPLCHTEYSSMKWNDFLGHFRHFTCRFFGFIWVLVVRHLVMVRHLGVWFQEDNRNGLLLLTRQSVVVACKQPTASQLLTMRQLRWVVLDAPEQRWLKAKWLLGFVVVLNAPEQRWLEAKRLLGSNAGSS